MRRGDLVGVIEAAYAIDVDDRAWLTGVHDAIAPSLEAGLGTCAYRYDASRVPVRIHEMVLRDAPLDSRTIKRVVAATSAAYVEGSWRSQPAGTASEVPGYDDQRAVAQIFRPAGIEDVVAVNAFDPSGVGVWVGAFWRKRGKLAARTRAAYNHRRAPRDLAAPAQARRHDRSRAHAAGSRRSRRRQRQARGFARCTRHGRARDRSSTR